MAKSTKRFVISTSGLNSQGFRMLTSGAQLDEFKKNPLLLFNHIRPEGNVKDQILPIGHWEDLTVEGDVISGVPVFDDNDPFAMQIYNKVEAGHIRMCSAGAEPMESSKKKADLLPGQKLATVTKWQLKEASICDIGANPDALTVALYDTNNKIINLSETKIETIIPKIETMSKPKSKEALEAVKKVKDAKESLQKMVTLAADKIALALADDETSEEEKKELSDENEELSEDNDTKMARLEEENKTLKERLSKLEEDVKMSEGKAEEAKATALADTAFAQRKITLAQKPMIVKMALADYKSAEDYLGSIKPSQSVKSQLGASVQASDKDNERILKLSEKSFNDLFKDGELQYLKDKAPDVYKLKYKEKFGRDPRN